MSGKYAPLERHLAGVPERRTSLTFQRIEDLIADRLPANARGDETWWANSRNPDRQQSRAWMDAGWHVAAVDLAAETVTFQRLGV